MRDARRPFNRLTALLICAVAVAAEAAGSAAQVTAPERFSVMSDGHPMAVWARRAPAPRAAILLLHGRTWSSRPDFDLQVPGLNRSVMASLAERGFAAYAVDLRGYGETRRDATGWLTPRRSAADVVNVLAWIAQQHPGLPPPALLGWSRGGAISMLAAQTAPKQVSALVLFGFAFDPDLEFADSLVPAKPVRAKNTAAAAASDFVSPKVTPPAVVAAFVAQALRSDPIAMDLRADGELNLLNPARLTVPTLLIFGQHDINVTPEDGAKFFSRLKMTDKQMVELRGADHAAHVEDTHDEWIAAVAGFVSRAAGLRP